MTKLKGIRKQVAGKAKQVASEVLRDQRLHEKGQAQEREGKQEEQEPSELNPLDRLNDLT